MTPTEIITQMRRLAWVGTSQYSDADAIKDLNTLKDSFWTAILSEIQERYNWEKWKANTIALQSEYTLALVAYNTAWTKLLNGVSISYDWETYSETGELKYEKCTLVNPNTLPYDWSYYVENQSEDEPLYYVSDNSIFIAPAPRTVVSNGLKLVWIRKIANYSDSTTEAEMKLPVDTHQAMVFGLVWYWLMNKRVDVNLINDAKNNWKQERQEAIKWMKTRVDNPVFMLYPEENDSTELITD
jgi:hypothetical protein